MDQNKVEQHVKVILIIIQSMRDTLLLPLLIICKQKVSKLKFSEKSGSCHHPNLSHSDTKFSTLMAITRRNFKQSQHNALTSSSVPHVFCLYKMML
eukprot:6163699-Ditylum_brightwellii.AAC.1